jgi:L-fuconolactonase
MQIDAHQHYWNPARGDYDWMPMDDPVLARPYGPADLAPQLAAHDITHTVLVQAAATVEETEYMLGLADATPHVAAVVGWIDFEKPADLAHLKRLANHPKFAGVRPMIQDIPDDDWMLRDDVQWAFRAIADLGLTFDALGFPRHLANFHDDPDALSRSPHGRGPLHEAADPRPFRGQLPRPGPTASPASPTPAPTSSFPPS